MFSHVKSAQTTFLKANLIDVEVDLSKGLHSFSIVGLPDKAVEESRDRVSAAIKNSGFNSPKNKNQKVVISLAPADLKKEGPAFDLPMALGYLLAADDIRFDPKDKLFIGELSLDGKLRPGSGTLACVLAAKEAGIKEVYLPKENAEEGALVDGILVYGVTTLKEIIEHLNLKNSKEGREKGTRLSPQPQTPIEGLEKESNQDLDLGDIKGQEGAKRALLIAAAGAHNIALYGPPGTGKTMLARALRHLLPPLSYNEILETTAIHSIAGVLQGSIVASPPFRSPHHTSSYVSVVGGGAIPKPGEITLSHRGVLFLDEFPEFDRRVIEALRQPLEERQISVSRSKGSSLFPANFILIAAMNPCPCGNFGSSKECVCSPITLSRYQRKISGPIIDRIDLWVEVGAVKISELSSGSRKEGESAAARAHIQKTRELQNRRFAHSKRNIRTNSEMNTRDLETFAKISDEARGVLDQAAERFGLSGRSYHRVIKIARTIADLDSSEEIKKEHLLEALSYRPKLKNSLI